MYAIEQLPEEWATLVGPTNGPTLALTRACKLAGKRSNFLSEYTLDYGFLYLISLLFVLFKCGYVLRVGIGQTSNYNLSFIIELPISIA